MAAGDDDDGDERLEAAPTVLAPFVAKATEPSLLAMTECPKCHVSTPVGRFCSDCGATLGARRFCSECGARLLPAAPFCDACGAKVS